MASLDANSSVVEHSGPAAVTRNVGTRVFQNTVVQLGGRGFSLILSAAASILLARYLGRERLGEFGALYAYLALFSWLATFGLEQILAREVSQRRADAGSIFFTATITGVSLALLGTGAALLLAPWFGYSHELRLLLLFAAIDVLLLPPLSFAGIVFQVDMRQWYAVGFGLLRQALWLLAVVLLLLGNAAFVWVIACRTLCAVVQAGVTLPFCWKKQLLPRPWFFSWTEARQLLRYGLPLVLSSVAVGVYHRIDQVMLHKMSGDHTLGPYVVAVQMAELFSALPVALMSSLFPVLALAVQKEEQFQHYLGVSYRFLMVVVFAVCAVLTPIAGPLVQFFYGKQFAPSAGLLIVLIWSEVPIFFGVVLSGALVAKNLQRYLPLATVAGAAVNIVLNLIWIPRWGALGASWATVVSYCLAGVLIFLVFSETRRMTWQGLRIALAPLFLALGITAGLAFVPWAFWWKFVLAVVAYVGGAWLTGTIQWSEVHRVGVIIRSQFNYAKS